MFHIFSDAIQIFILIISALYLGVLPQITAFTICFGSLKRYAGGAHASRHWICLCGFTALAYSTCFLGSIILVSVSRYASVIASVMALLLVLVKAPVAHPNNPKPVKKLKQLRKIAIFVALVQFAAILLSCLFLPEWTHLFFLCGSLGELLAAVTLILPIPSKSRGGE